MAQYYRMGHAAVSEMGRYTKGTGAIKPPNFSPALTRWIRAGKQCASTNGEDHSSLSWWKTPEPVCEIWQGGPGEGLRRNQGDTAGVKPGTSPVDRRTANVGTTGPHSLPFSMPSRKERIGAMLTEEGQWGGDAVVVRDRESRSHGEGRQRFQGEHR